MTVPTAALTSFSLLLAATSVVVPLLVLVLPRRALDAAAARHGDR